MCPTCNTKNCSLKHMCPMLKEAKKRERDIRGYEHDDYPKQVSWINDRVRNSWMFFILFYMYIHLTQGQNSL